MSGSVNSVKRPPSTFEVFKHDLSVLRTRIRTWLEALLNQVFSLNQQAARTRSRTIILGSVFLWLVAAVILHPLRPLPGDPLYMQFIRAVIAPDVIRHVLVILLAYLLSMRYAAIYLDDLFELEDVSVAEHFIRDAAFGSLHNVITIKDGNVAPLDENSPIKLIGGPGLVNAHLENAALFEKIDGDPHVIATTIPERPILDGFERLRQVIDLRDQVIDLTVDGRTQDGIPVTAKDVRLVYSIYRGFRLSRQKEGFQQPYPFVPEAIRNLVYKQGSKPLSEAMWSLIRSELSDFISKHRLSEFLTNAYAGSPTAPFIPREQITYLFYLYAQEFSKQAKERGVELDWIGVGTWVTPSQIIPDRHLEAWKISCENWVQGSDFTLANMRKESRLAALLRLVDDILASFYQLSQENLTHDQVVRRLVVIYREKLRNARKLYKKKGQPVPPEINVALKRLMEIGAHRLGEDRKP